MTLINENQVVIRPCYPDKDSLFQGAARLAKQLDIIDNTEEFVKGLFQREEEVSTCFEHGIAIPHCRSLCVKRPSFFIVQNGTPIHWDEENDADFIILLAIPETNDMTHIRLLSSVARKLVDDEFVERVKSLEDAKSLAKAFSAVAI